MPGLLFPWEMDSPEVETREAAGELIDDNSDRFLLLGCLLARRLNGSLQKLTGWLATGKEPAQGRDCDSNEAVKWLALRRTVRDEGKPAGSRALGPVAVGLHK